MDDERIDGWMDEWMMNNERRNEYVGCRMDEMMDE